MSLAVAAIMLVSAIGASNAENGSQAAAGNTIVSSSGSKAASASAARTWVALLDQGNWTRSWSTAGAMFKSQVAEAKWTSMVRPVREPLGAVASRRFEEVTRTKSLPGAPDGEYEVIRFRTDFTNKHDGAESVVLAHAHSGWKVVSYFIR